MSNEFTTEDFASMLCEMENEQKKGTFVSPYWKPANEGTYPLRIITPLKQFGEKLFYEKHKMHYINNRAYFCLNQTLKDKNGNVHEACSCPICNRSKAIYNTSQRGTEDWTIAGQLRAKDRYVSRIIVRGKKTADGADDEAKPEFWEFGSKIYEYFFNMIKSGQSGNFLSLKDGRDYNLSKKGTGRNTDYGASSLSFQQTPIFSDPNKLKQLLEYLPKMEYSQLVEFVSPEEMQNALNEMFSSPAEQFTSGGASATEQAIPSSESPYLDVGASSVSPVQEPVAEPNNIDDLLNMI